MGIIGAGLAGLRCADILLQHGFQVTIIEGRDRIGGRLYQERLGNGHLVDMGPNWIHGTDDNPMLDLAKQTGTAVGTWDLTSYVFDEAGSLLPVKEGEALATMVWDIIQDAFVYSNKSSADIDENISLLDFFKEKVVEKIPETEENFQKKRETVLQMSEMWGTFIGSPVGQQSLKFFWLEECIEGGKLMMISCFVGVWNVSRRRPCSKGRQRTNTGQKLIRAQRISFARARTKRSCRRWLGRRSQMRRYPSIQWPTRFSLEESQTTRCEFSSRAARPCRLTSLSSHVRWGG